ncbi:MAG: DUF1189 family protein [Candidatus Woesearchaeota archaeon]
MLLTFNPAKYEKLAEGKLSTSAKYFVSMLAVVFIVMCILMIPALVMLPDTIESELGKFDALDMSFNHSMKEPIKITDEDPQLIIDTTEEHTGIEEGKVLVTKGAIIYNMIPFTPAKKIVREGDLLENKGQMAALLMLIFVAMLPTLLVAFFLYFLLKYLLIIIAALLIGFVIARVVRFGIFAKDILKTAFYASTIMVVVGLLTAPFASMIYYIDIALFAVYFTLGVIKVGSFESVVKPDKKKEHIEK